MRWLSPDFRDEKRLEMAYRSMMARFNKIFATVILIGVFVLFVVVIFGVFNIGAVLG